MHNEYCAETLSQNIFKWCICCNILFYITHNAPCVSESCIEIKIKLNFLFQTSLWYLKRFYEGLKAFEAPQRSVKIKYNLIFSLCPPGLGREQIFTLVLLLHIRYSLHKIFKDSFLKLVKTSSRTQLKQTNLENWHHSATESQKESFNDTVFQHVVNELKQCKGYVRTYFYAYIHFMWLLWERQM